MTNTTRAALSITLPPATGAQEATCHLVTPTGSLVDGICQTVPATAYVFGFDAAGMPAWTGTTDYHGDAAENDTDATGATLYVDQRGEVWPETACVLCPSGDVDAPLNDAGRLDYIVRRGAWSEAHAEAFAAAVMAEAERRGVETFADLSRALPATPNPDDGVQLYFTTPTPDGQYVLRVGIGTQGDGTAGVCAWGDDRLTESCDVEGETFAAYVARALDACSLPDTIA